MKVTKKDNCIEIQMPIYLEDVIRMLKESEKAGLDLQETIKGFEDYVKENPKSPYVRGS